MVVSHVLNPRYPGGPDGCILSGPYPSDQSGMGGPTRTMRGPASIAHGVAGAHKPPYHVKVTSPGRFADDTIVYIQVKCEADREALQQDLVALEAWETKWGMSFNPSKCSVIHISRKKAPLSFDYILKKQILETSDSATYLGITITKDLSWTEQISKITSKANRSLGFLRRNIRTNSENVKTKAYNSIVRPTLEYAATVWSPWQKGLQDSLEAVQRRAARYVKNKFSREYSVTDMIQSLGWESLQVRRLKMRIILLFKIIHDLIDIPADQLNSSNARTRGHNMRYRQISARQNYYRYSFLPHTIEHWNNLPPDLVKLKDLDTFKTALSDLTLDC